MAQNEIINLFKKSRKGLKSSEISRTLKVREKSINSNLRKLLKQGEIEIDKLEYGNCGAPRRIYKLSKGGVKNGFKKRKVTLSM